MFIRGIISKHAEEFTPFTIPAGAGRRMARIQRDTCERVYSELNRTATRTIDGIYAATALGCLEDTEKFLDEINGPVGELRSPLPFMRSTHNTMAGQLAMLLGVKGPNLTYSQTLFGFHAALLDALLHLEERPAHNVAVFAADERTDLSTQLSGRLHHDPVVHLGHGVEAFVMGGTARASDPARITHIEQHATDDVDHWNALFEKGFGGVLPEHILISTFPEGDLLPEFPKNATIEHIPIGSGMHGTRPALALAYLMGSYASGSVNRASLILDRFDGNQAVILVRPC